MLFVKELGPGADNRPGSGCKLESGPTLRCEAAPSFAQVVLKLGDRDDFGEIGPLNLTGLIEGGTGDDQLTANVPAELDGDDGDDDLFALSPIGNDVIDAGDGDDSVIAGFGSDVVSGRAGNNTIEGGDGDDLLEGDNGNDTVRGGAGADFLEGDEGVPLTGGGTDTLEGGPGDDELQGGNDRDTLVGGSGLDLFFAGAGPDAVDARDTPALGEEVHCGLGNDSAQVDAKDDKHSC